MRYEIWHRLTAGSELPAAAIALLSAIGFYFFPLISDDLNSLYFVRDSFLYGVPIDFNSYWENIISIFYGNHFRFPNLLMPCIMLLPKWLPALVSGLALYYIIRACANIGLQEKCFPGIAFILFSVVFLFPWNDQLYLISFQAPYLWGAAIALWIFYKVLYLKGSSIVLFVSSTLLGFWMEAYAGALFGAFICLYIFYPSYRTNAIRWGLAGLILGMICCVSPLLLMSKWTRWTFFSGRMELLYPFLVINVIYAVFFLALVLKGDKKIIEPINLSLLEISIASAIVCLYFKTGARLNGFGAICSCIGICRLLFHVDFFAKYKKASKILGGLLIAFTFVHLIAVDFMCRRLGKETDFVVNEFRKGGDKPIFASMTFRESAPLILLQKPYYDWFSHDSTLAIFNLIYGEEKRRLSVVPDILMDFKPSDAHIIDGNAGVMVYHGLLVSCDGGFGYLNSDYGSGSKIRPYHSVDFELSGAKYSWLHLENTWLDQIIHPIPVRIDKLD